MAMNDMFQAELFGNQMTRTFADIFPDVDIFIEEWNQNGITESAAALNIEIDERDITLTYFLLYSRYGNSHIASFDENQFKYKLWSLIFQFGPSWSKKVQLQNELRQLNLEDISTSKQIYNHSFNPSTEPSTATLEELTTINEQNTATHRRSKGDNYALFFSLLDSDFTEEYIARFKKLFIKFVYPTLPLWYITEGEH